MIEKCIESIPIAEIRVVNPRSRDKIKFQAIVASIAAVGLKRPITVTSRTLEADGTRYDLVCGEGRMKGMAALGEKRVPALVVDASREEQFLMSLVENIARRPPSNRELIHEVRDLSQRNYKPDDIARKLGLDRTYIYGIVHLLEHSQESLVEAVEAGRLPISVAVNIAGGNDHEVQRALAEAYEKGELRGGRLRAAKRIIAQRIAKQRRTGKANQAQRKLTGDALVREYQRQIREQKSLVKKAGVTRDRLLLLISALRQLLADEHFLTLLRAEQLIDMPEQLEANSDGARVMLEQETESLLRDLKAVEDSYGTDILSLTVICGYIERLLGNVRVERHLSKHQPDILSTLRASLAETKAAKTQRS